MQGLEATAAVHARLAASGKRMASDGWLSAHLTRRSPSPNHLLVLHGGGYKVATKAAAVNAESERRCACMQQHLQALVSITRGSLLRQPC